MELYDVAVDVLGVLFSDGMAGAVFLDSGYAVNFCSYRHLGCVSFSS